MSVVVNVMLSLMSVMSHPCLVPPIVAHGGKVMYYGRFCFRVSLVSWIVMISACVFWISSLSSSRLFLFLFMLIWSIMKLVSRLLLALCACVVYVVMRSHLVCLLCCLGTLCGCGGYGDCDVNTVVCFACEYGERVWVKGVRGGGEMCMCLPLAVQ